MTELIQTSSSNILRLEINRPEARNSLNGNLIEALIKSLSNIPEDTQVIILTGAKSFCSGVDLNYLETLQTLEAREKLFSSIAKIIKLIQTAPIPVIAEVNGFALAGGLGLVAACDFAVASDSAVFGLPEIQIGMGALVVMATINRLVNRRALTEMVLTGERITASRALEMGLINSVVSADQLKDSVSKLATKLLKFSKQTTAVIKEALFLTIDQDYPNKLEQLALKSAALSLSEQAKRGIESFKMRTK